MFGLVSKKEFNALNAEFNEFVKKTNSLIDMMIQHENDNSLRIKTLEDVNANIKVDLKIVEQRLTDHRVAIAEVSGLSDKQEVFMGLVKGFLLTSEEFEMFCQDEVTKEEIKELLEEF